MNAPFDDSKAPMDAAAEFRRGLLAHGLIVCSGAGEIAGYSGAFEAIVDAVSALVGRLFADAGPEILRFPAILTQATLEKSRYLEGFAQLAGNVHCFCGDANAHRRMLSCIGEGQDWPEFMQPAGISLTPAACYHVYPLVASRGAIPPQGLVIDVSAYCYRHEPSLDPARLQMFRQREHVFFGTPEQADAFQENWLARSMAALRDVGLDVVTDIANDAFFGRFQSMMSQAQRAQKLKFEILAPVADIQKPTACGSSNNHKTHFSAAFGIHAMAGGLAHTACAGFGLERLALALLRRHGFAVRDWPAEIRDSLRLHA